jgi:hypothetical protein
VNKSYNSHPLWGEVISSSKYSKVNGFLTATKLESENQDMGVMYALVCKWEESLAFGV